VVADQHVDGAGLLERSRHGGSVPHVGRVDADANAVVAARVALDVLARAAAVEGKEKDRVVTAADRGPTALLFTLNGPCCWARTRAANTKRSRATTAHSAPHDGAIASDAPAPRPLWPPPPPSLHPGRQGDAAAVEACADRSGAASGRGRSPCRHRGAPPGPAPPSPRRTHSGGASDWTPPLRWHYSVLRGPPSSSLSSSSVEASTLNATL
jgi:hypothetical protein